MSESIAQSAVRSREVRSFYADLHADPNALRVCHGTSCMLAGAADVRRALERGSPCRTAYCLGYCDRSPVVLHPDARVARGDALDGDLRRERSRPAIRCRAREAVVTERIARSDCSELERARAAGVYAALERALGDGPEALLSAIEASGERGRGGAGFPTGLKWRRCAQAPGPRVVVANGDEGDPGAFIDRVLLERDPHAVIEGLALCAYAVGASAGVVYVRSEYPEARARIERALSEAAAAGILGESVLGSGFRLEVSVFSGQGSYVCGEETAMLNAIEGRRGEVRLRPPYPVTEGLHGRPTVVNNVETLVNVPWIAARGADAYRALGTRASAGTKALCLNAGFERPGIVEVEFGVSLREVIEAGGGGGRGGAPLEAAILGGPMGSVLLPREWDVPVCYGEMSERGIQLGHGGLVALPEGTDLRALVEHWLAFMADESCGKCVPCRLGSRRALDMVRSGAERTGGALARLLDVIGQGSLCGFGQLTPAPISKLLQSFPERFSSAEAVR